MGVNSIYNTCVNYGVTPSAKTPAGISNAIPNIANNYYNYGYNAGISNGSFTGNIGMLVIVQLANNIYCQISSRVYVTNNSFYQFAVEGHYIQYYNSSGQWTKSSSGMQVNTSWY